MENGVTLIDNIGPDIYRKVIGDERCTCISIHYNTQVNKYNVYKI